MSPFYLGLLCGGLIGAFIIALAMPSYFRTICSGFDELLMAST